MKKMLIAASILLLILGAALLNVRYLDNFISALNTEILQSQAAAENGDFDTAVHKLNAAIEHWNEAETYTHVLLRHSDIDSTEDAFYELLSALGTKSYDHAAGAYAKLRAHLHSIASMEHLYLGSIF